MKIFQFIIAVVAIHAAATGSQDSARSLRGHGKAVPITLYYEDHLVRSIATPTSQPGKGVDPIYVFAGTECTPVIRYAPGDKEYSGGRWAVCVVFGFEVDCFTNATDVLALIDEDDGVTMVRNEEEDFVCPIRCPNPP